VAQDFSQLGKMRIVNSIGDSLARTVVALLIVLVGPQGCESVTRVGLCHTYFEALFEVVK